MKKLILLTLTLLVSVVCIAQNKKAKTSVHFYGVDFLSVNVIGAQESEKQLSDAFGKINGLLITEAKKYNVGKFLNLDILSTDFDFATQQTDNLRNFKDNKNQEISTAQIIRNYPNADGNALLIIVKELNKTQNKGTFIAVIFDGQTKQIVSEKEFSGKANGFGLRNFWAGSLYDGLKKVE